MSDAFQFDVFLSHSAKDNLVVRELAERLKQDGIGVWFDEWEIKPGDSIPAKIEEGLEQSRVLVLCMSANAFGSDWAQLESGTFRFRDPLNKKRRFIPLRLDNAPIKGSLAQFLYINWLLQDREKHYAKLLEACRHPAKWPQPSKKKADKGSPQKGVEQLYADGLDQGEVLRAIREFHRAVWDYRDSSEWVQRLGGDADGTAADQVRSNRAATRDFCRSRNVDAWRQAAATLPIILRAGEYLGFPSDDLKKAIAGNPLDSEGLEKVEKLVQKIETRLMAHGADA